MVKKDNTLIMVVLIVAAILLVGSYTGYLKFGAGSLAGAGTPVVPGQPSNIVATCEGSTAISVSDVPLDMFTGASRLTDYNVTQLVNGQVKFQGAASTALTAPSNSVVDLYFTDATSGVTGFHDSINVGCSPVVLSSPKAAADSALTTTMYDLSTGPEVSNVVGTPTAIGAGQSVKAEWFITTTSAQKRFGTIEGGGKALLVIDYNSLVYKQPFINSVEGGTATLDVIPTGHVVTAVTATGNSSVAYLITTDNLADTKTLKIKFQADALTGATNPGVADGNIGVTLYDSEMYQRAVLPNGFEVGFRNKDTGADLGQANATKIFYVS